MKNGETNTANRIIRSLNGIVDYTMLVMLFVVALVALYALWDAHQVYAAADITRYITYKPTEESELSFDELREMNSDVIGWLSVYDTRIDYPVLNSKVSNDEYISRNPFGEIEASGSLFIDHNNSKAFTDFNTIIFGHHMAQGAMFGDIDLFLNEEFFDTHAYGNLFFNGKNHGIQFFSISEIDSHSRELYRVPATTEEEKQCYLDYIDEHTKYRRDVEVTINDQIILLSTCSEDITNGRLVLAGKLLNRTVRDPFEKKTEISDRRIDVFDWFNRFLNLPIWEWIIIQIVLIMLVYLLWRMEHKRYKRTREKRRRKSDGE